jgi:hypothetical protein
MIRVTIKDPVLALLPPIYANKLNATSRGARYAMNAKKKAFKEAVRLGATVEGEPVEGDNITAIYALTLPRCDWDAPIKSLQDACEALAIASRDDRFIKNALTVIVRPGKETTKRPQRDKEVVAEFYSTIEEKDEILARIYHLLDWSQRCWAK